MKFAVLKWSGFEDRFPPPPELVKQVLEPYLVERGWKSEGVAFADDAATVVAVKGNDEAEDLDVLISGFYRFVGGREKAGEFGSTHPQIGLYLTCGAEVLFFGESTAADGSIFANFALSYQLESISKKIEQIYEGISGVAARFRD